MPFLEHNEPREREPKPRVLLYARKGFFNTVSIVPVDNFSESVIQEDINGAGIDDVMYSISTVLPDMGRYLVEYHSRFTEPDDIDVWYTLAKE